MYFPVFEKKGNRFIIKSDLFTKETHHLALCAGYAATFSTCVTLDIEFKDEVLSINGDEQVAVIHSSLDGVPVALLSGPEFDRFMKQHEEEWKEEGK